LFSAQGNGERGRLFGRGPRTQSASATGRSSKEGASSSSSKTVWDRRATWYKYLRMTGLVASVYTLGYQMGVMDFASNPDEKEKALLRSVLKSAGCADPDTQAEIASDGDYWTLATTHNKQLLHRVAVVGEKIVHAGKLYARQEKERAQADLVQQLSTSIAADDTTAQLGEVLAADDPRVQAANLMDGGGGRWQYILFDSPMPNAFVTQLLPRKIFVTKALLDQCIDSSSFDDELAMVLGHEVSHLILGHVGQRNKTEAVLSTVEVMLLSVLDVAGMDGIRVIIMIESLRRWFGNAYSREHEAEADKLGIQLAAMACFDTRRGAEVFRRMMEMESESVMGRLPKWLVRFEMDHPLTVDRYKYLVKASETENAAKYSNTACADVCRKFKYSGAADRFF